MRNHILLKLSLWIIAAIALTGVSGAMAQDLQTVKERMKERLPVIDDLKSRGIVGENNKGFLEFVGGNREKPEVVQAENADRAIVYQAIAKQQGVSPELVGQQRAKQLRELAKPGEWLQNEQGNWYQK